MPGLPEDLLEGPHANHPEQETIIDDKHARDVQTDERVRRALAGRARVESRLPETGERVFYYRKTKNNKKGTWVGPGTVIGREGVNHVDHPSRALCPLRPCRTFALPRAKNLARLSACGFAQEDLDKLLNADSDEPGAYEDAEGDADEEMPLVEGGAGEIAFDMDEEIEERRGVRHDLVRVPPRVLKRQRRKGRGEETS